MFRWRRRVGLAGAALACCLVIFSAPAVASPALEVIGRARTNNRTDVVTFRIERASAFVSALRVRSGSLPVLLVAVEIEFADGGLQRSVLEQTLAPGQQSRAIPVDARRAISRIIVVKRPGLREGETELQVLGVPEKGRR
jgi:hypothetical protein